MSTLEPGPPGALSRWAARAGVALIVLSLGGLAALWTWDRSRVWPTPRFDAARFVVLAAPAESLAVPERWCAVVNPQCPHCRLTFALTRARREATRPRPALELLVVDAGARPGRAALAAFPADAAWWDSSGVWRHAWGHRAYGEVLRFAPDGTLRGVDPPPAPR